MLQALTTAAALGFALLLTRRWLRRWAARCRCGSDLSLRGLTALVTGPTSGLGRAAALEMARRGAHVVLACRSVARGERAAAEIARTLGPHGEGRATVLPLDLASQASVRHFVALLRRPPTPIQRVDRLVLNAGLFGPPPAAAWTEDGLEAHWGVNHLGHFLLALLLLRHRLLAPDARVISVASSLARRGDLSRLLVVRPEPPAGPPLPPARRLYAGSKLANCLFARELHRRKGGAGLVVVGVGTGGMVRTGLFRHAVAAWPLPVRPLLRLATWLLLRGPEDGCQALLHCVAAPDSAVEAGRYYPGEPGCRAGPWPLPEGEEGGEEAAQRLWELSERLCGETEASG